MRWSSAHACKRGWPPRVLHRLQPRQTCQSRRRRRRCASLPSSTSDSSCLRRCRRCRHRPSRKQHDRRPRAPDPGSTDPHTSSADFHRAVAARALCHPLQLLWMLAAVLRRHDPVLDWAEPLRRARSFVGRQFLPEGRCVAVLPGYGGGGISALGIPAARHGERVCGRHVELLGRLHPHGVRGGAVAHDVLRMCPRRLVGPAGGFARAVAARVAGGASERPAYSRVQQVPRIRSWPPALATGRC